MSYNQTLIRPMTNYANAAASRTATDMNLTVWQSEVYEAFQPALSLVNRVSKKSIPDGATTARFAKTWKMGSEILEAGASVIGSEFETGYIEIGLDTNPLVASYASYDIDELFTQYNARAPITNAMGAELATQAEKRCFALLSNSAVVANDSDDSIPESITDATLGITAGVLTNNNIDVLRYTGWSTANVGTAVDAFLDSLNKGILGLNNKDVPKQGRRCAVNPILFHACRVYGLAGIPVTVSSNLGYGGTPSVAPFSPPGISQGTEYGASFMYQGIEIFEVSAGLWGQAAVTTGPTLWRQSTANVEAILFHEQAVGWVEKYGVKMETVRKGEKLQWLTLAHTMHGGGALRPYCAINICGNGS